MMKLLVVLLLCGFIFAEEKVKYDNYLHTRFEGTPENVARFHGDNDLYELPHGLRFLGRSFLLPPSSASLASEICQKYDLTCTIEAENFQLVLDMEEKLNNEAREKYPKIKASLDYFRAYRTFDEFNKFLDELQQEYPQLVTSVFNIGKSINGRDIKGISFTGLQNRGNKPAMVYNAGQHAREWIAPMTVAFVAYSLLCNYSTNPEVTAAMDNFEWFIIPLVNPDGYNYTWTTDRLWRKNRRINSGSSCVGVDNNRNWAYRWLSGGSSTNPCSETYAGVSAFSEPEETHLANFIAFTPNVQGYIDFHAAGYLFLCPWGYTAQAVPPNYNDQFDMSEEFVTAVRRVHGKTYVIGSTAIVLYVASGCSTDWVYAVGNVDYSLTIELREGTSNIFILPPEQIIPQGQEVIAGVVVMAAYINSANSAK